MIQQNIREFNGQQYTIAEGAAIISELNARTISDILEYNNLTKIGNKIVSIMAIIENLTNNQLDGYLRYDTLAEVTSLPNLSETVIYRVTNDNINNGSYYYDGANVIFLAPEFKTEFNKDDDSSAATMKAIHSGIESEIYNFGKNIYDKEIQPTPNGFLNNSGDFVANSNTCTSYYIKLKPNTNYYYSGAKGLGTFGAIYDKSKQWTRHTGSNTSGSFLTTNEEYFFRVSLGNAESGTSPDSGLLMLTEGNEFVPLQYFYKNLKSTSSWHDSLPENAAIVLIDSGQSNSLPGALSNISGGSKKSERQESELIRLWNQPNLAFENQNIDARSVHGYDLRMQQIVHKYNRPFYIISGGVSGTNLDYHLPGGDGYINLWEKVQAAINNLLLNGKRPYVYLNFSQGDADSQSATLAADYGAKIDLFVNTWRDNLGADLPIIQAGTNETHGNIANRIIINNFKRRQYADGKINAFYETLNLEYQPDGLHRTYEGYKKEAEIIISKIDQIGSGLEIVSTLPYSF